MMKKATINGSRESEEEENKNEQNKKHIFFLSACSLVTTGHLICWLGL